MARLSEADSPSDPAIEVAELSKTFRGGVRALDSVSLKVVSGEMVALIGSSGAGKSTLLRHICGLTRADQGPGAGTVRVLGRSVQRNGRLSGEFRGLRQDLGVLFQQFNLVPRLSVLCNVLIGRLGRLPRYRSLTGLFPARDQREAMRALDRVGIAETALQRAQTLSGGQQQRAAIARLMVQGARVVLADEPVASLDPASSRRVMELLAALCNDAGVPILVSLHQVEYAWRYCSRTIAMRNGKVVFDGPSRALDNRLLEEIYGSHSEELIFPGATCQTEGDATVAAPVTPSKPLATGVRYV
jgi:phosphonate transport system ATP-binding protein